MKVLVVEDDETVRSLIDQVLSDGHGIEVATVGTGGEGLQELERTGYDVVVLDYELPESNGLEVLESIQAMEAAPAVVFLTGEGDEGVAYRALSEGAVDYLVKDPATYEKLPRLIKEAHDEWAKLGPLVQTAGGHGGPGSAALATGDKGGLDPFLARDEVEGVLVHDGTGRVVLSSLDEKQADLLAKRSAALGHQAAKVGESVGMDEIAQMGLLRGEDLVLAHASAPDRLRIIVLYKAGTRPSVALEGIRRAARIVRDELASD